MRENVIDYDVSMIYDTNIVNDEIHYYEYLWRRQASSWQAGGDLGRHLFNQNGTYFVWRVLFICTFLLLVVVMDKMK